MRRKNLEKAIIMSIVLMGLNNGCLAADVMTSSEFEDTYKDKTSNTYNVNEDVIVANDSQTQIGDGVINVTDGAHLTLGNVSFGNKPTITGDGNITITLTDLTASLKNQFVFKTGADITANSLFVTNSSSDGGKGMAADCNSIVLNVKNIYVEGLDDGIYQSGDRGTNGNGIDISGFDKIALIGEKGYGLVANSVDGAEIIGNEGSTAYFESKDDSDDGGRAAIGNRGEGKVTVEAAQISLKGNSKGVYAQHGEVTLTASSMDDSENVIDLVANKDAVYSDGGNIKLTADTNIVVGGRHGIVAELNDSAIDITGNMNIIGANSNTGELLRSLNEDKKLIYGDQTVIWAAQVAEDKGKIDDKDRKENPELNVNISAETENLISGAIRAENDSTVTVKTTGNGKGGNYILSSAHGKDNEHIVAAVYAKDKAVIDIKTGENGVNYIATDFTFEHKDDSERTVWAQRGGKINIEGQTTIVNSNPNANTGGTAGNSYGIAVTAGTGETDFSQVSDFDIKDTERSTVTIKYLDGTGTNGNTVKSSITGDIVSGYGGLINIQALDSLSKANSTSGLIVKGNALAANGGKLNLDIGNGGVWTGRADDYGDAGVVELPDGEKGHTTFFDPAFSNEIVQGGQVKLTMGEGSRWNVTGQSWITSINTGNSDIAAGTPIIDLVNANTDRDKTAHALTVYELKGNAIFNMSLDGNRKVSDMLYIKNADGEYVINVVDSVSVDDMYKGGFDGLRFATIGDGSNVSFRAITYNQGINNVEYEVGQDAYNKENSKENDAYNSSETDGGMNSEKPGSDMVEGFFDSTGTPENPQGPDDTEIMTLENTVESDSNVNGTTNFKLIGVKDSERSDGGKTVVNMSKVNYSNAVYMDRLNKRLGEARYINTEEDQGMWVRMRHDRIGKDNEFRIMNTMYELGYDEKQECDNGERRVGAAIDYMDGSSEYTGVGGSGDVSRKGI